MSHYPGYNGPPPPYYGHGHPPPPPPGGWHGPHRPPHSYPPRPDGNSGTAPQYPDSSNSVPPPYPYYVPGAFMIPVPVPPVPAGPPQPEANPTYITNYIYHSDAAATPIINPAITDGESVELSGEFDWVPTTNTTASHLTGKAVVGGHEGWDGSPLWVIRAWYRGDLIPGKFSIRHNSATIAYDGKEIPLQNIEVLVARPESLRWIPASNGNVPPGAISAGNTASGEPLYVGRARHQLSVTPGKIHPSHGSCYISFAGTEVAHKNYDVLCRIS